MSLVVTLFFTVILLAGIVWACGIFTNAIEWLGHRFKLSEGAVGSVLAAVGTALPETLVPIVALVGGAIKAHNNPGIAAHVTEDAAHIGVGAILGAPFLLSTLALFLAGASVLYFASRKIRGTVLHIDLHLFKRDLNYFFPAYGLVLAASFVPIVWAKWVIALALLALYAVYVQRTLAIEHVPDEEFDLEPLMLARRSKEPKTGIIVLQTFLGLAGIFLMAHLFVNEINVLSRMLVISPLVLSLILTPIATELPEKFNSVVWLSKKKDNLALGNITGAMVFQSCVPTAIGIVFTPWVLDFQGGLSVVLCFASAGVMYFSIVRQGFLSAKTLLAGGFFYLIFLCYSVYQIIQG